jgi:RNA polymerase sigma-70 factor (ECF subfamily)
MAVLGFRMVATMTATAERVPTADEFCRLYADDVCRFAAMMSRDRGDAEDLAQEALARAVRSLRHYDPSRGPISRWLWRIVANAARDAAGRRRRMTDLVTRLGIALPREVDHVEDAVLRRLRDADLHAHLRAMPLRDQVLLGLRYTAGLDTSEVADAVGLSTDTASRAIRRALARLRARLKETDR